MQRSWCLFFINGCIPLFAALGCYASERIKDDYLDFQIETVDETPIDSNILLTEGNPYLYQACKNWHLSHQQIKRFFMLSERYSYSPYSLYYQVPCDITGTLTYQQKIWKFTINGGATGRWQHEDTINYFGCHVDACESLVILPTDMMQ